MRRLLLSLLLFSGFTFTESLVAQTPAWITDSLDVVAKRSLEMWQLPGMGIAIVKDGEVVWEKGYGVREYGKNKKVDENTLFQIASNTKAFTGTAVAILAAEEKCTLKDPVKKWVPGFKWSNEYVENNATLTDVLSHRMGLKTFQGDFTFVDTDLTQEEILAKLPLMEPEYDFRTKWGYFNAGFMIAGMAIEAISGQSYEAYIREHILAPLEMNRTLMTEDEFVKAKNIAMPHNTHDGTVTQVPPMEFDQLAPAGAMVSSVHDMSHWLIANLNQGKYNGKQALPAEAIATAQSPVMYKGGTGWPMRHANFSMYALGWQASDYEGRRVISHTGGLDGMVSSVTLIPEEKLGIVILTNTSENMSFLTLKAMIMDAYLGKEMLDFDKAYKNWMAASDQKELARIAALKDTVAMAKTPPIALSAFVGTYTNKLYGKMTVKQQGDGSLMLTLEHHPGLNGKLEYLNGNRLLCTFNKWAYGTFPFPFKLKGGKVFQLSLQVNGFIEEGFYDFVKD